MHRSGHHALSENLSNLMKARQIDSENRLAKLCGVDQKTINNLLDTERDISPRVETLQKIADHLKLPMWALFFPNLPARFLAFNGLPEQISEPGFCLITAFEQMNDEIKREILGYAAYVLDRTGDTKKRDEVRDIAAQYLQSRHS